MDNSFNLIDESWIPVVGKGLVSLQEVFSGNKELQLGGNAMEKISLWRFLFAICQSACTPDSLEDWNNLGEQGLAEAVNSYLVNHKNQFWLHGERPFLQYPEIEGKCKDNPVIALMPSVAQGNTTIVFESQRSNPLSDAEKALLLLVQMSFAFGGKKADNTVVLSPEYSGKTKENGKMTSGKFGPALGFAGILHSLYEGSSLLETCYINLLTKKDIGELREFEYGIGVAPWDNRPQGEDDSIARKLKSSYMGHLVPMCRFMYYRNDGVSCDYTEGLSYPTYKEGVCDLTCSLNSSGKDPKILWVDPEKKPWRQLPALLSYCLESTNTSDNVFLNQQLFFASSKIRELKLKKVWIWAGGIKVSSNSGEFYLTGTDDYVESAYGLDSSWMSIPWYKRFSAEMVILDQMSRTLYGVVCAYYGTLTATPDVQKSKASSACSFFWQEEENNVEKILDACGKVDVGERLALRRSSWKIVLEAYSLYCPSSTARQLDAWAKCRPNPGKIFAL